MLCRLGAATKPVKKIPDCSYSGPCPVTRRNDNTAAGSVGPPATFPSISRRHTRLIRVEDSQKRRIEPLRFYEFGWHHACLEQLLNNEEVQSAFFVTSGQICLHQINLCKRSFSFIPKLAGAAQFFECVDRSGWTFISRCKKRHSTQAIECQFFFLHFGKKRPGTKPQPTARYLHEWMKAVFDPLIPFLQKLLPRLHSKPHCVAQNRSLKIRLERSNT